MSDVIQMPAEKDSKVISKDVLDVFEQLVVDGTATKNVVISDKAVFTLKTLNMGEVLDSENISIATMPGVPKETVEKVRILHTLTNSISAINGNSLYKDGTDDDTREYNAKVRARMYENLIKLTPEVLTKLQTAFLELTSVKDTALDDLEATLENFSTPPGEK